VSESINIEIRFKPQSADIISDEIALLEFLLPDIIRAMQTKNDQGKTISKSVE
jgi:hypothetical protein